MFGIDLAQAHSPDQPSVLPGYDAKHYFLARVGWACMGGYPLPSLVFGIGVGDGDGRVGYLAASR
jgi:hypothetical protein